MPERQALDPALRALLDEQTASAPNLTAMNDADRVVAVRATLPRALAARESIAGLPNKVMTRDLQVANDRPARLYTPPGVSGPLPLLVYFHGGGWVGGTLDTHQPFCCLLSAAAETAILSVDYRQPPEHRFPAAVEDAIAATRWAVEHAASLGADRERVGVGGDSAGGNLAAVAALRVAEGDGRIGLRAQLLLYPVTSHPHANHPSYDDNATGYGLTAEAMRWFWRQYAPEVDPANADASPLSRAELPALPPALVATAEYDVLRDEGRAYADKLQAAGVAVTRVHAPDMHHNYPVAPGTVARFPQSLQTLGEIAGWLRAALGQRLPTGR